MQKRACPMIDGCSHFRRGSIRKWSGSTRGTCARRDAQSMTCRVRVLRRALPVGRVPEVSGDGRFTMRVGSGELVGIMPTFNFHPRS